MAQHDRTLRSHNDGRDYEMNFHQCSVVDLITIDGAILIHDAPKAAAAIIEMYRFRGYSVDELLEAIRIQIQEWDDIDDHS